VRDVLKELYPHTGNAYVVGVTGAPGVGKSTMVDQMVAHLRKGGKTVGVLAVDPTSPFSGGAILGDRVRMQRHSMDTGVFIRSLATRGHFGGLTQSTRSAVDVLDAMGKDYVLIETVGVGQDEVDVMKTAHTTVVTLVPGMGDDIQAIKAGILEVGDIFVINKADREGVERTVNDLQMMLEMDRRAGDRDGWKPPILETRAVFDMGIEELIDSIAGHSEYLKGRFGALGFRRNEAHVRGELQELVKNRLVEEVLDQLLETGEFDRAVKAIVDGEMDPYSACDSLLLPVKPG
ncbi:MAG TPA: methylmalonyl Co-A mutase-associated GTPase MeaB, partial [Desulfobacteraceae bacterium]|nr:methylmalonyl Co-A mutase-associated GTPase MeaB [Desulfobacteraceae bacterium]